jgi:beta-carotene 3-hydroxylase
MKQVIISTLVTLTAFAGMEGVAWLTHKYLMHGFLWFLHHDHHYKQEPGFLERNDYFFLIFAIPGIFCLLYGTLYQNSLVSSIGVGITLYGACYFFVHDIFIHQRFKILRNSQNGYLKAIRRAHKIHHKHIDKEDGECFGMLWVPRKYFKENRNSTAL